jgi:hypothetical protein
VTPALKAKSDARESLHSVDLEEVPPSSRNGGDRVSGISTRGSDTHARATLIHPDEVLDPLDVVLEGLRNVKCRRAVEAASVCLASLVRAVGCRAALAHLWDAKEKSFVVVYVLAPSAGMLLNTRHGASDPLFAEAFGKRKPRVINYGAGRTALARHGVIAGAWSVLVAPVMEGGEKLGVLELVDPLDGSCFDDRAIAAAHYAAERLSDLLAETDMAIGKVLAFEE